MRKQYKHKRRSCSLCKPNKTGYAKRWTSKEELDRHLAEKEKQAISLSNNFEESLYA